ncbi:MAG: hypothetical protein CV087_17805 [Candidatus Brocadia sp. WS118]|nr:MAG: hypothetical protein CV087_17805 [Candidatus Brocadia sp. WS118]
MYTLARKYNLTGFCLNDSHGVLIEVQRRMADQFIQPAAIIGTVTDKPKGKVLPGTSIGNKRILDMLSGEQLPRIC